MIRHFTSFFQPSEDNDKKSREQGAEGKQSSQLFAPKPSISKRFGGQSPYPLPSTDSSTFTKHHRRKFNTTHWDLWHICSFFHWPYIDRGKLLFSFITRNTFLASHRNVGSNSGNICDTFQAVSLVLHHRLNAKYWSSLSSSFILGYNAPFHLYHLS